MRNLRVGLIAVLLSTSTLMAACTSSNDDDDDDGFTPSGTNTPTPTPTTSPTPTTPPQPITERTSFVAVGGTELWLCFEAQFTGQITDIHTEDTDTPANCAANLALNEAYVVETPTFTALRFTGLTGCDVNDHSWYMDYVPVDDRCTGDCVAQQYDFTFPASDTFGALCGPSGVPMATIITGMAAYESVTTGLHRFRVDTGAAGSVQIEQILVYADGGTAVETECTAAAVIVSNGTGLFDGDCTPDPGVNPLTPAVTYEAMIFGKVGETNFIGSLDFDYENPPTP